MPAPTVLVLDTRGAGDASSFRDRARQELGLAAASDWAGFGHALSDRLLAEQPVLVIWTGSSDLPFETRREVMRIMSVVFVGGANLFVVDEMSEPPAPDFAVECVQVAIPAGSETSAVGFWTEDVGLEVVDPQPEPGGTLLQGDQVLLRLVPDPDFRASNTAPAVLAVRDLDELSERLAPLSDVPRTQDRLTARDPFGNRIEFIRG